MAAGDGRRRLLWVVLVGGFLRWAIFWIPATVAAQWLVNPQDGGQAWLCQVVSWGAMGAGETFCFDRAQDFVGGRRGDIFAKRGSGPTGGLVAAEFGDGIGIRQGL